MWRSKFRPGDPVTVTLNHWPRTLIRHGTFVGYRDWYAGDVARVKYDGGGTFKVRPECIKHRHGLSAWERMSRWVRQFVQ